MIEDLAFDASRADAYNSPSQKIRILSEFWVSKSMYCPSCGQASVTPCKNNSPVADFYCEKCSEEYELKSQKHTLGRKIVDGAYATMMGRLKESNNPNLLLLNYNYLSLSVINLIIIPKHFFTPDVIEIRKPLALSARRAGWVGCNIVLESIPHSGRIFLVRNQIVQPKTDVIELWKRTLFLRDQVATSAKGWLLSVMKCVEDIGTKRFSLSDVYKFEDRLRRMYPNNNHIKEKIRQQLQILRDNGYLRFVSNGIYETILDARSEKTFR